MKFTINEQEVEIPSSLSQMTLKQRIDYQLQFGNELDEMTKSCLDIKDEVERELELAQLALEKMYRGLAFFTGYSVEAIKETEYIDLLSFIYWNSIAHCFKEEEDLANEPQYQFIWNNEMWVIHTPDLKNGDKMLFEEFLDGKQIVQNMYDLGKNRWESLIPLAAIYLRKKDEVYDESFIFDGSERQKLMESLPMDIALHVGFFLSNSLNSWREVFLSSAPQD